MNSYKRDPRRENVPRQVPPPPGSRSGVPYTRFIPREELQGFATWTPDRFVEPVQQGPGLAPVRPGHSGHPVQHNGFQDLSQSAFTAPAGADHEDPLPPEPQAEAEPVPDDTPTLEALYAQMQDDLRTEVAAARQQGYQDGYRDGLVALESFKESFARQTTAQVGQVLATLDTELGALEQMLASRVTRLATELARQVVRSELSQRPALVVQVAQEAINAVLMSARHITVQVNPDDHALVAQGCQEALAARGARLVGQAAIARGGCRVESDAGVIDAGIASRWAQATAALGTGVGWAEEASAHTEHGTPA
jgi:flagellar assembly protein FliH